MINFLKGTVEYRAEDYLVLDVHDIGYSVFVCESILKKYKLGENIKLFIYQNIREDGNDLYGFEDRPSLDFFKLLLTVSGIGPKTAMNILAKADAQNIKTAVSLENPEMLVKGYGIGKKTAERLIMELKSKIKNEEVKEKEVIQSDILDALENLGYTKIEITDILKIMPAGLSENEKIKWALKNLAKN